MRKKWHFEPLEVERASGRRSQRLLLSLVVFSTDSLSSLSHNLRTFSDSNFADDTLNSTLLYSAMIAIAIDNRSAQAARAESALSNAARINTFGAVFEEIWHHLGDELSDDQNLLLFVHKIEPGALAHSSDVGTVFIYYVPCHISVFLRRLTGGGACAWLLAPFNNLFHIILSIGMSHTSKMDKAGWLWWYAFLKCLYTKGRTTHWWSTQSWVQLLWISFRVTQKHRHLVQYSELHKRWRDSIFNV